MEWNASKSLSERSHFTMGSLQLGKREKRREGKTEEFLL